MLVGACWIPWNVYLHALYTRLVDMYVFFANIMSPKRNRSDGQVVDFTSRLHMQNAICHGFLVYFYKLHLVQDYLKKHIPKNLLGGFLPGFKSWLHFHPDPWGR